MIVQIKTAEDWPLPIEVIEATDPVDIAQAQERRKQFDLNSGWLTQHISEVYSPVNRGKIVCIAGQEAFFGDTVGEAIELATNAHPSDHGWFTRYIPRERMARIYAT